MDKICLAVLLSSSLLLGSPYIAANEQEEPWFSLTLDNDIFVGSDGGYTNGIYASWFDVFEESERLSSPMPWYFWMQQKSMDTKQFNTLVEIHNVGQTMVTPSDISAVPPPQDDLPYAGFLFWQGSLIAIRPDYSDISTLMLGVVGPISGAELTQRLVHEITGSETPQGWDYQLKNEPIVNLSRARFWRLLHSDSHSMELDMVGGLEGALGNFDSHVEVSGFLRWGQQLESSYPTVALVGNREANPMAHSGGYFVYVGAGVGYVFNNLFIDGNYLRDSPGIELEHERNFLAVGAAFSGEEWGISINYVDFGSFSSDSGGQQRFGSFSFLWRL
ncbi:lipid A deacylase LpxR family protein [Pleionea sp. CnH1-48]|uniref:lipid A deacylase LpxR family protein n=1 Tax=Pleionea sp. CnH1-48 TaxID=2954494 RepID=UPI0020969A0E|nr:lipid A deacylase LpxR family protein [Pleionea sp. CnH1-48]MCO7224290.1 lipid A deacylase LpxR family protein [Pleionea sp. CnH1-48]